MAYSDPQLSYPKDESCFLKTDVHAASQNVTLFGSKVFAVVISEGSGDEFIRNFGWASNPVTGVLTRRREETERHTGKTAT